MRFGPYILTLLVLFTPLDGFAVEIIDATVEKDGDRYHVYGSSLIQASPEFVYDTLMDFDNFHKIAGGIKETRFVDGEHPDEIYGYTLIESCVLFYCRKAEKLEKIDATPHSEIRTRVIPDKSDFVINDSRWTISRQGDATLLKYESEFEPDFWLPPLISAWAIKRKLVNSAETIGMRIEYLAQQGLTLAQIRDPNTE